MQVRLKSPNPVSQEEQTEELLQIRQLELQEAHV